MKKYYALIEVSEEFDVFADDYDEAYELAIEHINEKIDIYEGLRIEEYEEEDEE